MRAASGWRRTGSGGSDGFGVGGGGGGGSWEVKVEDIIVKKGFAKGED